VFGSSAVAPLYHRLVEALEDRLEAGVYPPDSRFPSEAELCAEFGVSRTTVRQTLQHLVAAGYLQPVQGRGTYVRPRKLLYTFAPGVFGVTRHGGAEGGAPPLRTQVLEQRLVPAPEPAAEALGCASGSEVIWLRRLRWFEGEPIILLSSYLPPDVCAPVLRADFQTASLTGVIMDECGVRVGKVRRTIEHRPAGLELARVLGVRRGSPLLWLEVHVESEAGRVIDYEHVALRADRVRVLIDFPEAPRPI